MELTGELKEKVEKAESKEEAKKIIEDAGMELTDEELDMVAGGQIDKTNHYNHYNEYETSHLLQHI